MKNTDLIKIPHVEDYFENKAVKEAMNLQKDTYTVEEAAEYFWCSKSQIKGYHNRYKELFKESIIVTGEMGKQKTLINQKGMYLLALVLSNKSIPASQIASVVEKCIYSKSEEKQMSYIEESIASKATAAHKEIDKSKEEKKVEMIADMKEKIEEIKKDCEEVKKMRNESNAEKVDEFLAILDKDIETINHVIELIESNDTKGALQALFTFAREVALREDFNFEDETEEIYTVKEVDMKDGKVQIKERQVSKEEFEALKAEDEEKKKKLFDMIFGSCEENNCSECEGCNNDNDINLEEHVCGLKDIDYGAESEKRAFENATAIMDQKTYLTLQNQEIDTYVQRCLILGIAPQEASILVQNCVVNEDMEDIDSIILEYLLNMKRSERNRQRGVLREFINLLAIEKFEKDYERTYHWLADEMKYVLGINMFNMRRTTDRSESYLDMIVDRDGVDVAIELISNLLAE